MTDPNQELIELLGEARELLNNSQVPANSVLDCTLERVEVLLATASALAERNAGANRWIPVKELPDSDVDVALIDARIGRESIAFGELEFTDDSEGHGQPYWETTTGEKPIDAFTHWKRIVGPLPPPPEGT